MDQSDFVATLQRAVRALEQIGIPYHLTGGLVSSYYGEPRLTQDIDFVVAMKPEDVAPLIQVLAPQFLVDRVAMEDAVSNGRLFQGLDQRRKWQKPRGCSWNVARFRACRLPTAG